VEDQRFPNIQRQAPIPSGYNSAQFFPSPLTAPVEPHFQNEIPEESWWDRIVQALSSRKIAEVSLWLLLLVLFVPSSMALASWNAVPGDPTYSWKIGLEKALLVVLKPSKKFESKTHVALTKRRFEEATKVLEGNYAQEGLTGLSEQVTTTTSSINDITSQSTRKEVAQDYIKALTEMKRQLASKKQNIQPNTAHGVGGTSNTSQNNPPNNLGPTSLATSPRVNPTTLPGYPTPTAAPGTIPDVDDQIEDLEEQIDDAIEDLETAAAQQEAADQYTQPTSVPEPTATPEPTPAPEPTAAPEPTVAPEPTAEQSRENNRAAANANSQNMNENSANKSNDDEDKDEEKKEDDVNEDEE
jgi:hypothetical protein